MHMFHVSACHDVVYLHLLYIMRL